MTDDLKPCPFCGGEAYLQSQQGNNPEPFAWDVVHHCRDGFIRFDPRDRNYRSTKAEAIAAWNTRPEPSVQEAARVLLEHMMSGMRAGPLVAMSNAMKLEGHPELFLKGLVAALRALAEKDTPNE